MIVMSIFSTIDGRLLYIYDGVHGGPCTPLDPDDVDEPVDYSFP